MQFDKLAERYEKIKKIVWGLDGSVYSIKSKNDRIVSKLQYLIGFPPPRPIGMMGMGMQGMMGNNGLYN